MLADACQRHGVGGFCGDFSSLSGGAVRHLAPGREGDHKKLKITITMGLETSRKMFLKCHKKKRRLRSRRHPDDDLRFQKPEIGRLEMQIREQTRPRADFGLLRCKSGNGREGRPGAPAKKETQTQTKQKKTSARSVQLPLAPRTLPALTRIVARRTSHAHAISPANNSRNTERPT